MARKKNIPKYIASLEKVLSFFFLGALAFFFNLDYFSLNEESFLALNSLGFFFTLGLLLRKQTGKLFFFRAHRLFRVFRYVYRIGFRWLRRSVWCAYIGHIYVKQLFFSTDFNYRRSWRPLLNRLSKDTLKALSQQLSFFFFSFTPSTVSRTRIEKSLFYIEPEVLSQSLLDEEEAAISVE